MIDFPGSNKHPRVDDWPSNVWVDHTVEVTAGPIPGRISVQTGYDESVVEFQPAINLQAWEAAVVSASGDARGTGTVVASGGAVKAGLSDEFVARCITDGAELLWRLDAPVGNGNTIADETGNGHTCTQGGTASSAATEPADGFGGIYLTSSPSSNFRNLSMGSGITPPMTAEAIVNVHSAGNWPNFINHGWVGDGWLLAGSSTVFFWGLALSGGQNNRSISITPYLNRWVHLVGTYDGDETVLYVTPLDGGTDAATDSATGVTGRATAPGSTIGMYSTTSCEYDAAMVAVYDTALTAAQVAEHAALLMASGPGLITFTGTAVQVAAGEGTHLVKIYGQDLSGNWSP